MDTIIQILVIVLLTFLEGIFVAAEIALVTIRRTRIEQLVDEGNPNARRVKRLIALTQLEKIGAGLPDNPSRNGVPFRPDLPGWPAFFRLDEERRHNSPHRLKGTELVQITEQSLHERSCPWQTVAGLVDSGEERSLALGAAKFHEHLLHEQLIRHITRKTLEMFCVERLVADELFYHPGAEAQTIPGHETMNFRKLCLGARTRGFQCRVSCLQIRKEARNIHL